jgi:hypothetical protein
MLILVHVVTCQRYFRIHFSIVGEASFKIFKHHVDDFVCVAVIGGKSNGAVPALEMQRGHRLFRVGSIGNARNLARVRNCELQENLPLFSYL